jgi:regulator of sigma E protease
MTRRAVAPAAWVVFLRLGQRSINKPVSYLAVFLIVGLLIFVHELGHFVAARWVGIPIARLSLGMGPAIWSRRIDRTEYRLSWIPLGGYVLPEIHAGDRSFLELPIRARMIFALGGPVANVLFALALFSIESLATDGISLHSAFVQPLQGVVYAIVMLLNALPIALSGEGEVAGFLGVVAQGGAFIDGNVILALRFTVVMSLNLAILNMLPIPPLDGGKCVLYVLEWLYHGANRLQVPLNAVGLLLLLGFIGYTTVADLLRILQDLIA